MTRICFLHVFLLVTLAAFGQNGESSFDVVIRNGRIVNGTGSPWYQGDVGIRQGKIAAVGNLADRPATLTLRAVN